MMVLVAGASLLIEAGNPLAKGSAYFLLSAYLNEKNLRGKAYRALLGKFRGDVYEPANSNALALYSLATITYLIFPGAADRRRPAGMAEWPPPPGRRR